ncbi:MAG: oligosaccharide flippase family protein [Eubacteriales bacterium]|nr:oligosaccharide flippase family protein [Eubacteriales bacterium]
MKKSRTQKSITNTVVSFTSQIIIILLGFISRRVLIYSVGVQYLGINGLMSNILTIFSLAESGIGIAIGYSLYKPLAENDVETIKALMRFYRTVYRLLALMTAIAGLLFYPFLPVFLKGNTASEVSIIYFLFLASSVCSYLWSYKITLNSSDQNKYLYTIANTVTQILVLVVKIFILYFTQNYVIYLCIELGSTLVKNVIFSCILDRRYPFLKEKNVRKLSDSEKHQLSQNIKSLFWGKFGYIASQCSDNLVISSIISVTVVGLYSNYTTLVSAVSGFVTTFTSGVTASMGNLIASESKEKAYAVYKRIDFINYWLYTFSAICLLCLTEPFIKIWLGKDYILPKGILIISIILFYLKGLNSGIEVAKNAAGLYYPDRFVPLLEALFNLVISIILAYQIGLLGVLLGTLISFLLFSFWTKPYFVFRDIFHVPFCEYVICEGRKIIISFAIGSALYVLQMKMHLSNMYLDLLLRALLTGILSNVLLCIVFCKTSEFEYVRSMVKAIANRVKRN